MEWIGFALALVIGISLGLLGGGGSILTVPVFVYVFGFNPIVSTSYSLFVVGAASIVGAIQYYRQGQVNVKTAIVFAIPALIAVYLARAVILPVIPETFEVFSFEVSRRLLILGLFGFLMLFAARSMIVNRPEKKNNELKTSGINSKKRWLLVVGEGLVVGLLTGMVGAGGGFLIVPVLVLVERLSIKTAIGTSLVIISIKSLIGFAGDIQAGVDLDFTFLALFASLSIAGIFLGTYLSKRIPSEGLKKTFGYFVLVMAVFILFKEFTA